MRVAGCEMRDTGCGMGDTGCGGRGFRVSVSSPNEKLTQMHRLQVSLSVFNQSHLVPTLRREHLVFPLSPYKTNRLSAETKGNRLRVATVQHPTPKGGPSSFVPAPLLTKEDGSVYSETRHLKPEAFSSQHPQLETRTSSPQPWQRQLRCFLKWDSRTSRWRSVFS